MIEDKNKKNTGGEEKNEKKVKTIRTFASDMAKAVENQKRDLKKTTIDTLSANNVVSSFSQTPESATTSSPSVVNNISNQSFDSEEQKKENEKILKNSGIEVINQEIDKPPQETKITAPFIKKVPAGETKEKIKEFKKAKENIGEEIKQLEEEFNKEIGENKKTTKSPKKDESVSLEEKAKELKRTKDKIEEEIKSLEENAKKELTGLKETKKKIEGAINKIKELEKNKNKIEEEINKIKELEENKKKSEEEIKSLEGGLGGVFDD